MNTERKARIGGIVRDIEPVKARIAGVIEEEQEIFDNLSPEQKESEHGANIAGAIASMTAAFDLFDTAINNLDEAAASHTSL
jgi:hypothetical protein